jgi:dTMP kinase
MSAAIRVYPELRRACPESRRAHYELRGVYSERRRAPISSQLASLSECLHAVSRSANSAKLNRQTPELERLVSRRKQTAALRSNRQNFHFCPDEISTPLSSVGAREHARSLRPPALSICEGEWFRGAVPGTDAWLTCSDGKNGCDNHFSQFLPGTAPQVECDVTHSKQSTASFLPGATTPQFGSRMFSRGAQCRLRQGTPFCPELRRAAARVNALRQGTALAVPSVACPNEEGATQLNYSFRADSPARAVVAGLNLAPAHIECAPFLTGSARQTEIDVTHSKQTTEKFLTGARTAFKEIGLRHDAALHPEVQRPAARVNGLRQGTALAVPNSAQHSGVLTPEVRVPRTRAVLADAVPLATSHSPLAADPYVRLIANSMPARGKFIVLEGIDGSGKRTQLDMLARDFASRNVPFAQISFPRYDGFFGKLAARYLNGEFGSLEAVDAHFSALLYAGDRFEAKPKIESDLASGKTLLADRYVGSNLAHQGARVPREKRTEFLQWLRQFEYQVYALPAEDLVIYLRVPPVEAHRLIGEKGARNYTKLHRDIQESDLAHLQTTSEVYDQLAQQPNWLKIECYDSAANALRSAESIHQEILAAVQAHITPTLRANK